MQKKAEPQLTTTRYLGKPCLRCGSCVRCHRKYACVRCQKDRNNQNKARRRLRSGPYREISLASKREWSRLDYSRDKAKYLARSRGRMRLKRRIPAWADRAKIAAIYRRAKISGKVVDHIVPLVSPVVCGLHVETNLRVVMFKTNARKSNKLIERLLS